MIQWSHYPKSTAPTALLVSVVDVFEAAHDKIDSAVHALPSNDVLALVRVGLEALGFEVETGKRAAQKIHVPVLYGQNGKVEKYFEADAYHAGEGFVIEVEAGRAVVNNQFLKDLFQACMMRDAQHLLVAVRCIYGGGGRASRDFDRVVAFFDTMYASNRLALPLTSVSVLGY